MGRVSWERIVETEFSARRSTTRLPATQPGLSPSVQQNRYQPLLCRPNVLSIMSPSFTDPMTGWLVPGPARTVPALNLHYQHDSIRNWVKVVGWRCCRDYCWCCCWACRQSIDFGIQGAYLLLQSVYLSFERQDPSIQFFVLSWC